MSRPTLHVVTNDTPPPADTHVTLSPGSRNAFTALEARVGDLRRIFSGPSCPVTQAARIKALADQIRVEAERVSRLART